MGESADESSDDGVSFDIFRLFLRGVGSVRVVCCVRGELVVRRVC